MTLLEGIKQLNYPAAVDLAAHAFLLPALRRKQPGTLFFLGLARALDLKGAGAGFHRVRADITADVFSEITAAAFRLLATEFAKSKLPDHVVEAIESALSNALSAALATIRERLAA